jgi:hypothetical protein
VSSAQMAAGADAAWEQTLAAAHRKLLQTPGLQFDFKSVVLPKRPSWLEPIARLLEALGPFLKLLFWGGLAIGVGLLVYFIGRELLGARFAGWRRKAKPQADAGWRPEPAKARALLEDADRLAAEGRFDEAAHLILFRSIDDLAERKPGVVRPALTSRDIAGLTAMPAIARAAFANIARAVETSFFGARQIGAEGYAECRGAYEAFAFAEGWR